MNLIKNNYNGYKGLAPRRIDLFSEFSKDLDQVFNEVFGAPILNGRKSKGYPLLDAIRTENKLILHYTVPGVRLEDLSVDITEDADKSKILTVSGKLSSDYSHKEGDYQIRELSSQEFRRCIKLPEDVVEDEPDATLKDGVLKLIFKTKLEEESQPLVKKINIKPD